MEELGISLIAARSPEAKGRIERMAGTFQDRLKLRLSSPPVEGEANKECVEFLAKALGVSVKDLIENGK